MKNSLLYPDLTWAWKNLSTHQGQELPCRGLAYGCEVGAEGEAGTGEFSSLMSVFLMEMLGVAGVCVCVCVCVCVARMGVGVRVVCYFRARTRPASWPRAASAVTQGPLSEEPWVWLNALLSPSGNSNNFWTKTPHFHVLLDLKNSVADSETSQNLVDGCIRHLVSIVLNLFTAKNGCMVRLVPSTLGPSVSTACLMLAQPRRRESYFSTEWPLATGHVELTQKHFLHSSQG